MKQKTIIIIEPSTSGLELLSTAVANGHRIIVLSANRDERIIPDHYKNIIHELIEVDTNNLSKLEKVVVNLNKKNDISAIIPGFEIFVAHAAKLANMIGVPGLSPQTGEALRDKNKMRIALKNAGVNSPTHYVIYSEEDIQKIPTSIKFPVVIKPIDQSGSVHVSRVDDIKSLINAYQKMCQDKWTEMAKGVGSIALIEEYIDGPEFSVEGYINNQVSHIVSITEKFTKGKPYFVEMGHIVSAPISQTLREKIDLYMQQIVNALHMHLGVYHAELRISQHGPILMEIAGRLAGDRICDLIKLSSNINLFQVMLDSHLGLEINLPRAHLKKYAGIRYFAPENSQHFSNVTGISEIKSIPGFHDFKLLIQPGEKVPPLENFMGRAAYCIFTAPTYDDLKNRLELAERYIKFF